MSPLLSIITVTFQDQTGLAETIRSIQSQDVRDADSVESIIVDGNSTYDVQQVVRPLTRFAVTLRSEVDDGIYDAMNIGTGMASGDWVLYLNSGDTFTGPAALSDILGTLVRAPRSCALYAFGAQKVDLEGCAIETIRNTPHRWVRHAFGVRPHCHQSTAFRRSVVLALGGYDLGVGFVADFDLIMRTGIAGDSASDTRVVVDYLAGGISEQRRGQIPTLLHEVRARRFGYGRTARFFDKTFTKLLSTYWRISRLKGVFR